jgi:hypothetical protein
MSFFDISIFCMLVFSTFDLGIVIPMPENPCMPNFSPNRHQNPTRQVTQLWKWWKWHISCRNSRFHAQLWKVVKGRRLKQPKGHTSGIRTPPLRLLSEAVGARKVCWYKMPKSFRGSTTSGLSCRPGNPYINRFLSSSSNRLPTTPKWIATWKKKLWPKNKNWHFENRLFRPFVNRHFEKRMSFSDSSTPNPP